jgi:hypothetical protein
MSLSAAARSRRESLNRIGRDLIEQDENRLQVGPSCPSRVAVLDHRRTISSCECRACVAEMEQKRTVHCCSFFARGSEDSTLTWAAVSRTSIEMRLISQSFMIRNQSKTKCQVHDQPFSYCERRPEKGPFLNSLFHVHFGPSPERKTGTLPIPAFAHEAFHSIFPV